MKPKAKHIKIGLDFHGVITARPEYFREFAAAALQRGWEVHIITGGPLGQVKKILDEQHIPYTQIFAIFDFYNNQGKAAVYAEGDFKIQDDLWNKAKAEYCRRHHITVQIDDSRIYKRSFHTPYCVYDSASHSCILDEGIILDLHRPVAETLDKIEQFFSL